MPTITSGGVNIGVSYTSYAHALVFTSTTGALATASVRNTSASVSLLGLGYPWDHESQSEVISVNFAGVAGVSQGNNAYFWETTISPTQLNSSASIFGSEIGKDDIADADAALAINQATINVSYTLP